MSVSEVVSVVSFWLSACWGVFSLQFPLFGITFKDIFVGIAIATISIRVVKRALGVSETAPNGAEVDSLTARKTGHIGFKG